MSNKNKFDKRAGVEAPVETEVVEEVGVSFMTAEEEIINKFDKESEKELGIVSTPKTAISEAYKEPVESVKTVIPVLEPKDFPEYLHFYAVEGNKTKVIPHTPDIISPAKSALFTLKQAKDVVDAGFTLYWRKSSAVNSPWFGRPITKDNLGEFAHYIKEGLDSGKFKPYDLSDTKFYR